VLLVLHSEIDRFDEMLAERGYGSEPARDIAV
jgi:hypothetical protein